MKHLPSSSIFIKLLTDISDTLFPPSAQEILLRALSNSDINNLYRPDIYLGSVYISEYTNKNIQAAITGNKFHHNQPAAKVLGKLLTRWLSNQAGSILLIPIPLGNKRLRERGHNQVETIIKATSIPTCSKTNILKRSIETLPQSQLNKKHRRQNIKNAFRYSETNIDFCRYTQVVLIDDVITTGSTLNEARATLAPHLPPHITLTCLALAH